MDTQRDESDQDKYPVSLLRNDVIERIADQQWNEKEQACRSNGARGTNQ